MPSIYLIANNPYYVNNNLKIPKLDDIIVRFNHGSINTLKLFNGVTNILVMRSHQSGFHGIQNLRVNCIIYYINFLSFLKQLDIHLL